MDAITNILDWLSGNSRNLSEAQKREIHDLLNSLRGQLETRIDSASRDHHQAPQHLPRMMDRSEQKYHEISKKVDIKNASLESKINHVTNIVSKETGYINGKLDVITREYDEQMKMLKNQIKELENEKNQREREEKKVSDQDIDYLSKSLKDLMNNIVPEPRPYPSNSNLSHPPRHECAPPPYQPYPPPMAPNPNMPYFPPPLFHATPRGAGPSNVSQFPYNHFGPSLPNPPPYGRNQKVYTFSGNSNFSPSSHINRGAGHPRPRFEKPFPRASDEKTDGNFKKNYCDSYRKKFDYKNKEHGSKNEFPNAPNTKPYHKMTPRDEQSGGDSNRGRSSNTSQFKNYVDRGKNKRFQQFGKNRPQTQTDGTESDTSTTSHVSSKITHQESANKTGHPRNFKTAPKKPHESAGGSHPTSNLKKHEDEGDSDTSTTSHVSSKSTRKEFAHGTGHPRNSKPAPSKNPQSSTSKNETSDLHKLQYPSKAEALKRGVDIHKKFDSPSTCLGKRNDIPISRPAHCLEDIYNFEKEFGSCQVIRF